MTAKTSINVFIEQQGEYPMLKVNTETETIVLFARPNSGTIMFCNYPTWPDHVLGSFSECWDEKLFIRYDSPIVIQNDPHQNN